MIPENCVGQPVKAKGLETEGFHGSSWNHTMKIRDVVHLGLQRFMQRNDASSAMMLPAWLPLSRRKSETF